MKYKNLIITFLLLIIVGGGSFFTGMKYQQKKTTSAFNQFAAIRNFGDGPSRGTQNGNRNGAGFRPIAGEIISMDNKLVTVKMTDGSSKIVILSDNTIYNKTQEGSLSDLKVGDNVSVFGTINSDESITAQNISSGVIFRGTGFGSASEQR